MHLPFDLLQERFHELPQPPLEAGRITLVVVRPSPGDRELPDRCRLTAADGVEGDRWGKRADAKPGNQITLVRADVARLVANGQRPELCGDNLHVELDLSTDNLPPGTRLRVGTALCEVTPVPHTGCAKFASRFGTDARAFTNSPDHERLRLRGIHVRVLEDGEVSPGDAVTVLSRPAPEPV